MFVNTKVDCGPCGKLHSEALRLRFEESGDQTAFDALVERDFLARVAEADRVIEKARARLEEEKTDEEFNPDLNPDIIRIQAEIQELTAAAETAGDSGDIDAAQVRQLVIPSELSDQCLLRRS